jgi:hypothetical protein
MLDVQIAIIGSLYAMLPGVGLCHHLSNPLEHFGVHLVSFMLHDTLMLTLFVQILALPFKPLTVFLAFPLAFFALFVITFETPTKLLSPECLILFQPGHSILSLSVVMIDTSYDMNGMALSFQSLTTMVRHVDWLLSIQISHIFNQSKFRYPIFLYLASRISNYLTNHPH